MKRHSRWGFLLLFSILGTRSEQAAVVSPLTARGYAVLPEPQRVSLQPGDFQIDGTWTIEAGAGVNGQSSAIEELADGIEERLAMALRVTRAGSSPQIELRIAAGTVQPDGVSSQNEASIAEQAYRLDLSPKRIRISANSETGLFYGAGTLLQLLTKKRLPEGEIVDWPRLPLRHMYWDDAHHLERLEALKAAVRDAAFLKINGFVIKLDGHFQYASAPAAVEPQALAPEQLKELTEYGQRLHVQVIPYLDAPGHMSFLLKHPEYASLRAFPDSNYEICTTNPASMKLLHSTFADLLAANPGVPYFYLSTDEAYYVGLADNSQCEEKERAEQLGGRGKLWVQFLTAAADFLHQQGREVIFWGEYPLLPEDIGALPKYLIDGETYGEKFDPVFRGRGIRQMIYEAVEGEEPVFPHYFLLPQARRLHPMQEDFERVPAALDDMASVLQRGQSDLIGTVVAGWGDMGLHPHTLWLGYSSIAAEGWRQWSAGASEGMSSFFTLWYGEAARNMNWLYYLLSLQAEAWRDTWDSKESSERPGIWGDSNGRFVPRRPAQDQTLALPPLPSADLSYVSEWRKDNKMRLADVDTAAAENAILRGLIEDNMLHAERHRFDFEIFLALAQICKQNLDLIKGLEQMDGALREAGIAARQGKAEQALAAEDRALQTARTMKAGRNRVLNDAVETWQKTWMPRVKGANGRVFLQVTDDVKDHLPDRTVDMTYLVYRELLLPMDDWYERTEEARNQYAAAHHKSEQHIPLGWRRLQ